MILKKASWVFVAIGLAAAGIAIWRLMQPDPPLPPAVQGNVPVVTQAPVVHGDPVLPKPDQHLSGVLTITIPDTLPPPEPGKPRQIHIYVPDKPSETPLVSAGLPIQATFSTVVDKWAVLTPHLHLGASVDNFGHFSPEIGMTPFKFWGTIYIGASISSAGAGPVGYYDIWREFEVSAKYNLIRARADYGTISIGLAYRF